jgi:hypothetical protein
MANEGGVTALIKLTCTENIEIDSLRSLDGNAQKELLSTPDGRYFLPPGTIVQAWLLLWKPASSWHEEVNLERDRDDHASTATAKVVVTDLTGRGVEDSCEFNFWVSLVENSPTESDRQSPYFAYYSYYEINRGGSMSALVRMYPDERKSSLRLRFH